MSDRLAQQSLTSPSRKASLAQQEQPALLARQALQAPALS
jgi:hypothetical protein